MQELADGIEKAVSGRAWFQDWGGWDIWQPLSDVRNRIRDLRRASSKFDSEFAGLKIFGAFVDGLKPWAIWRCSFFFESRGKCPRNSPAGWAV